MTGEALPAQRRPASTRALVGVGEALLSQPTSVPDATTAEADTQRAPVIPTQPGDPVSDTKDSPEQATNEAVPDADTIPAPNPGDPAWENWQLVTRAQAGDGEALEQIYRRYRDTVFRFVYFRVGNRHNSEDIAAETFLRVIKRIHSVTWQGKDLGAWLTTIGRNLVADYFKSGRYRFEVTTGDVLDTDLKDVPSPEKGPELAILEHITNVNLLEAVTKLNPEQRECIVLRFLQGYSVTETAQMMGKNEGAIKALQYRAVRALRRNLPEGFEP